MDYPIIPLTPAFWPAVRQIYIEGIATGNATFETELPEWDRWDHSHRKECRLLALEPTFATEEHPSGVQVIPTVIGWAALSPVSARRVYAGVAEVSVYVAAKARGRGVGKALLQTLVRLSEENGIWTLQAGIFPENESSLALHKSCGFREVGIRRKIGSLGGTWRDVVLLERRSTKVGT